MLNRRRPELGRPPLRDGRVLHATEKPESRHPVPKRLRMCGWKCGVSRDAKKAHAGTESDLVSAHHPTSSPRARPTGRSWGAGGAVSESGILEREASEILSDTGPGRRSWLPGPRGERETRKKEKRKRNRCKY